MSAVINLPVQGEQQEMFHMEMVKPTTGAMTLAHAKDVPLPHEQTAELLKRPNCGLPMSAGKLGDEVSIVGGSGYLQYMRVKDGKITWTIEVADLQIDL